MAGMPLPTVTLPNGTDIHAAFAVGYKGRENPPFDPRRYSTNPWYAGLRQGLMINDQANPTTGQVEKLRFLYNPSDYQVSYSASNKLLPAAASNSADTASVVGATTTTTGFSLLFDRTYELWDGNTLLQAAKAADHGGMPYAQPAGVDVDLLAFRRLVGIPDDGNGMMQYVPVHVYLGSTLAPHFLGYVTGAQVAISHFTATMIPVRAVIAIQMTQVLTPSNDPAANSTTANTPNSSTGGVPTASPSSGALPGQGQPVDPNNLQPVAGN